MDKVLLQEAIKLNKKKKRKKWWHKVVNFLAVLVVFCTTYALILPAITMEKEWACGKEAHKHDDSCYEITKIYEQVCSLEEQPLHEHDDSCYEIVSDGVASDSNAERVLICTEDTSAHQHGEECRVETGETIRVLICEKEEHIHDETCEHVVIPSKYICSSGEHTHSEACYSEDDELMCTIPEHIHDETCLAEPEGEAEEETEGNPEAGSSSDAVKVPESPAETVSAPAPEAGESDAKASDSNATKENDSNAAKASDSNALKASASNALKTFAGVLAYTGSDFTVTVSFDEDAMIPEGAVLDVHEIEPGTEEYETYYQQALGVLTGTSTEELAEPAAEEEIGAASPSDAYKAASPSNAEPPTKEEILFARFFDISFTYEGEKIEPDAPVEIQIQYDQPIEIPESKESVAVHFAEDGIELLNTELDGTSEEVNSFTFKQDSFSVTGTVLFASSATYHVWLDGTLGGLMSFAGSDNTYYAVSTGTIMLPETWKSPTRYEYKLQGWYDIYSETYYPVDPDNGVDGIEAPITQDTVFYADWAAATYAIGQNNADTVRTLDTSEFVTIDIFDYNVLFNTVSESFTGSISNSSHSETWSEEADTLNFLFNDWDASGKISRSLNMTRNNVTYDVVVEGIVAEESSELIDVLFDPEYEFIGKNYVGPANYLFQYMEDPDDEYYGYYYYDSDRNAASYYYNENDPEKSRFYVYDYLERTSDGAGNNADFIPLNSPYANGNGIGVAVGDDGMYYYESTTGTGNVSSNFHLGMRTNIHFYLPNDVGHEDAYGNPGNLDTNGKEMIFRFDGDDDIWVFVDGKLVLDLGGIHAVESGMINFSTGEVTNGVSTTSIAAIRDEDGAIISGIGEGGHNLTIYYLERGSSQSNCKMYFNLAPRYGLELQKQDYHLRTGLDGVEFKVFTDCTNCFKGLCQIGEDGHCVLEECDCMSVIGHTGTCETGEDGTCVTEECQCTTQIGINHPVTPAKLWNNHEEAKEDRYDQNTKNRFTVENGKLQLFGLVAGKTYYIAESVPADGYPRTDDLIRLTLNDHGTDVSELTILDGADDSRTQGYEIVSHSLDDSTQMVYLTVTNQKIIPDSEVTQQVRVKKTWILQDVNPAKIPDGITVHLTKDGKPYSHSMVLNEENGWTYTWTGLPADGSVYEVTEDQVPGFTNIQPRRMFALREPERVYYESWLDVAALEDGATFLIKIGNQYLAQSNGSLYLTSVGTDGNGKLNPSDQVKWEVAVSDDGFLISNNGYFLTLDGSGFKASTSGNQIMYYDGSGLFAMSGGKIYYLGNVSNGSASAVTNVQTVGLVKRELIAEDVKEIELINYQLEKDDMTSLEVEKVWAETNEPIWEKEVTIHLLADGKDTGMSLVLNNAADWKGTFEGLPIGPKYSVLEDYVPKYTTEYSDVIEVPGRDHMTWETTGTLAENGIYCFVNNGYAMTDQNGSLVGTAFNESSLEAAENQQWKVVGGRLQNVATGRYLGMQNSWGTCSLYVDSQSHRSSGIWTENGILRLAATDGETFRFISINGSYISPSNNSTSMKIYQGFAEEYPASYKITVTNTYGAHYLPSTGGTGTAAYTSIGTLLLAIAALLYIKRWIFNLYRKGDR